MSIFDPAPTPWPSRMLSVLRIVSGGVFITFGTMKLFNFFVFSGAGVWSMDAMIARSRSNRI